MSKLDKNQRIRTSKPKQDFDLSHDYLFTATTGQLRPVTHDVVQPGDYVKGKFNFFLRTMPLSTAAMVDVDFMVDYFFVPMELIWLPFGAWWSQTKSYPFNNKSFFANNTPLPSLGSIPLLSINLFQLSWNNSFGDSRYQRLRLLDDLGLSGIAFGDDNAFVANSEGSSPRYPEIFPWQLAAYECIYQHFYRNEEREPFSSAGYSFSDKTYSSSVIDIALFYPRMRYLNRMDDYFTASKLSPLVANINNNPSCLGNFDVQLGLNDFERTQTMGSDFLFHGGADTNVVNQGVATESEDGSSTRAINQLRALFAEEKLLHVMNMTNKNYDSQVLARLGYDVPKDVKHEVMHLGHDTCQLNIQEIVSGSNTFTGDSGSALGDLAGQGKAISRDFKGFSFTAPCHGVFMTIWTCRTRPKYTVSALRKDSIRDITDFFTPELDDLGMQPQYLYETRLVGDLIVPQNQGATFEHRVHINPNVITGWNYRYEYLKRNINRSSLAFMRGFDGNGQSYGKHPTLPDEHDFGYNSYSQWSSARIPLNNAVKVNSSTLPTDPKYLFEDDYYSRPHNDLYKVLPNELDNIMLVSWLDSPVEDAQGDIEDWDTYPWLSYQRDPFIVDGRFECHKRSAMSLYSMPKFI